MINLLKRFIPSNIEGLMKETLFPNGTVARTIRNKFDKTLFSKEVLPAESSFLNSIGVNKFRVNYGPTVSNMASHGGKPYNVISTVSLFCSDGTRTISPQKAKELFNLARASQKNGLKVSL